MSAWSLSLSHTHTQRHLPLLLVLESYALSLGRCRCFNSARMMKSLANGPSRTLLLFRYESKNGRLKNYSLNPVQRSATNSVSAASRGNPETALMSGSVMTWHAHDRVALFLFFFFSPPLEDLLDSKTQIRTKAEAPTGCGCRL